MNEADKLKEENAKLKKILQAALDEMNPNCQFCVHVRDRMMCTERCKWMREEEAKDLLGGEPVDS